MEWDEARAANEGNSLNAYWTTILMKLQSNPLPSSFSFRVLRERN